MLNATRTTAASLLVISLDVDRLIELIRVVNNDGPAIAYRGRAVGTLEQLAITRHQMYANVYWHHAVRSATVMFKHAFYLLQEVLGSGADLVDMF